MLHFCWRGAVLAIAFQIELQSLIHYSDVIMSAMASQITDVFIVCSTDCRGADQSKHQSSASLAFMRGTTSDPGRFPSQRASNTENVSIWWRHRALIRITDKRPYEDWHDHSQNVRLENQYTVMDSATVKTSHVHASSPSTKYKNSVLDCRYESTCIKRMGYFTRYFQSFLIQ